MVKNASEYIKDHVFELPVGLIAELVEHCTGKARHFSGFNFTTAK